jgi:signal transduction histidine kinase
MRRYFRWVRHPRSSVLAWRNDRNLQKRFIWRVLAPPFVVLVILGLVIFWQLDRYVRSQAIDELRRAASTTAIKLEREFEIRQTVLERTGTELLNIKGTYTASRQTLETNRSACNTHVKQKRTFKGAEEASCEPFLAEFALLGSGSLTAIEEGYARLGGELIESQSQSVNDRLSAYKEFFPETLALMVVDSDKQVVSSALSEAVQVSTKELELIAAEATTTASEGRILDFNGIKAGIFAYPIEGGAVLSAYNIGSDGFIRTTLESTPIDTKSALAFIVDKEGAPAYPLLPVADNLSEYHTSLRTSSYIDMPIRAINHIVVGAEAGPSRWLVAVASPSAIVLSPLRDAQLVAVIIIGVLLLGFLWVGAFFIAKTLRSIIGLVAGAVMFSSGKLDYKIRLSNADREFVSLADTMNTMATRIAAAEKELDEKNKEFISIATHELRTPLTAILGNLSLVYEDMAAHLDDTVRPLVKQVYESTNRLRELVNDMLDVARLEGGRAEFVLTAVDIGALATDVIANLQVTAAEKLVSLSYDRQNAQSVTADESRVRIVLNNFVSNAIKYNRPNGTVSVAHQVKDGELVTMIKDTGLGIPEDQKAHMFEKFFRVKHEDRKDVVGTGLGMHITREYVIKMGGEVWFESVHGQGTTFYFSLPLATSPERAVTTP